MKKITKLLFTTFICCLFFGMNCFAAESSTVQDINSTTTASVESAELLDSVSFSISRDGNVQVWENVDSNDTSLALDDVVTGTMKYYYHGLDSKKRPKYSVKMSIVSETKLKKSTLSTKAQGTSSWHNNKKTHSGKTGTNTRTYVYTKNAPSNPYCYAKATITISDGTVYSIPQRKLTNAIKK